MCTKINLFFSLPIDIKIEIYNLKIGLEFYELNEYFFEIIEEYKILHPNKLLMWDMSQFIYYNIFELFFDALMMREEDRYFENIANILEFKFLEIFWDVFEVDRNEEEIQIELIDGILDKIAVKDYFNIRGNILQLYNGNDERFKEDFEDSPKNILKYYMFFESTENMIPFILDGDRYMYKYTIFKNSIECLKKVKNSDIHIQEE